MTENTNKILLPSVTIVTIIIAVFSWVILRIEKVDTRVDKIYEMDTKIEKILQAQEFTNKRLEWLETKVNDYKKANGGVLNLEGFFEELFTEKDSSLK